MCAYFAGCAQTAFVNDTSGFGHDTHYKPTNIAYSDTTKKSYDTYPNTNTSIRHNPYVKTINYSVPLETNERGPSTTALVNSTSTNNPAQTVKDPGPEFESFESAIGMGNCTFPIDEIGKCAYDDIARQMARDKANENLAKQLRVKMDRVYFRNKKLSIYSIEGKKGNGNDEQNKNYTTTYKKVIVIETPDGKVRNCVYRDTGWDESGNEFEVTAYLIKSRPISNVLIKKQPNSKKLIDRQPIPSKYIYVFGRGCPMHGDPGKESRIEIARDAAEADALVQASIFGVDMVFNQVTRSVDIIEQNQEKLKKIGKNYKKIVDSIEAKFVGVDRHIFYKRKHVIKRLRKQPDIYNDLKRWGIYSEDIKSLGWNGARYKVLLQIPVTDIKNIVSSIPIE